MVRIYVLGRDELVVAELDIPPFSIFAVVFLEIVLEITSEDEDAFVEFDSLLQKTIVLHVGVPNVSLLCKVYFYH